MDKGKKIAALIVDMLLLGITVYSAYVLAVKNPGGFKASVYTALIVICIPIGFLVTYSSVAWNKFDEKPMDDTEEKSDNQI